MVNERDNQWWKPGVVMFAKVSGAVAVPIILALVIGKYLDAKYDTAPWIFLSLTAVAFMISLFSIYKSLIGYIRKIEAEEKKKREEKQHSEESSNENLTNGN